VKQLVPALLACSALDEERKNPTQGAYDDLPEPIKTSITPLAWSFLTDSQKADLERSETEPDWT